MLDLADAEATSLLLGALHEQARGAGAVFLKLEPDLPSSPAWRADLRARGFRPAASVQPHSSIVVDLAAEPEVLQARLSPRTRYNVRLAERKGLCCRRGSDGDLPTFYRLLAETAARGRFAVHPYAYYWDIWRRFAPTGRAHLIVVEHQGEALGATLFLTYGPAAYQFYGGSSAAGRQLKPNELLQWHALLEARDLGCQSYDLWGIPDEVGSSLEAGEAPEHPPRLFDERSAAGTMGGVYLFKRGFGGHVVRTVGAFDYVYDPARYWLWARALPAARRAALWAAGRSRAPGKGEGAPRLEAYEA
jgi:lipid II:glycine glycyltransferase (peptidoglycan interpeptide bridge formation enzyme)